LTLTTDKKQGTATIQKEDEKKRVWDHNTNGIVRVDVKNFLKKLSQQLKRRRKRKVPIVDACLFFRCHSLDDERKKHTHA